MAEHLKGDARTLEYTVTQAEQGRKVIDVMARSMGLSSRMIRRCKQEGLVRLNGSPTSVNALVTADAVVGIVLEQEANIFNPQPIPVTVVYEDDDILVVDKPAGLVVHPTKGHPDGTLGNALAWHSLKKGEDYKIRFVNRLDRDTTGLVIVAKNGFAQQFVSDRMQEGAVEKLYLALVHGVPVPAEGTVDAPIERLQPEDILRQVHETGKPCVTHYRVLETLNGAALVELNLETGRTHQIRVHMQHLGHPLYGDPLYGQPGEDGMDRQALHAWQLRFETPRRGWVVLRAPLPEDIRHCVRACGGEAPAEVYG